MDEDVVWVDEDPPGTSMLESWITEVQHEGLTCQRVGML